MKPSPRLPLPALAIFGVLVAASAARADITGFGDFSNFSINIEDGKAVPQISIPADSITLVNGTSESRSIFSNTPQSISQFTASYTFQSQGNDASNGYFNFVVENSGGPTAVGTVAGNGYQGITKSAAVTMECDFDIARSGLYTNGVLGTSSPSSPVNSFSNDPINMLLTYNGSILSETMTDTVTSAVFNTAYVVNLPSLLGSSTGYVGFTGADPTGLAYVMTVSDFQFKGGSSVPEPASMSLLAAVALPLLFRRRHV